MAGKSRRDYYLIKYIWCNSALQLEQTDQYLQQVYLPMLHKAGVQKTGVFKPLANDTAALKRIVLFVPVKNIKTLEAVETSLEGQDPFAATGNAWYDAPFDKAGFMRIETMLLMAFEKMPQWRAPALKNGAEEKIYELRSYESATEQLYRRKVHMFNKGGEVDLFDKLKFNAVFYAQVLAGARMPNLMYMTSFESMQEREAHWNSFRNDPDWKTMSSLPQYKNTVSRSEVILMKATSYSEL
jgi:hypothetical protein